MNKVLNYVGAGSYVPGVPATDLTQADIEASGYTIEELLAFHSGGQPVYEEVISG